MDVDTEHVSSSLSNVVSPSTRVPGGYPNLGRDSFFPHFSQFFIQWQRIRGRSLVFRIHGCNTNVLNLKVNDTCTYGPCCEMYWGAHETAVCRNPQIEIPALVDSWVTNTTYVNLVSTNIAKLYIYILYI